MYIVLCTRCGNAYESKTDRRGVCPDCRLTRSQINTAYRDRTYDPVSFYVPKGQRSALREFAASFGMSMNEFVNNAIAVYTEQLEQSKGESKQ